MKAKHLVTSAVVLALGLLSVSCGKKNANVNDGINSQLTADYFNSVTYQKPTGGDSGPSKYLTQEDGSLFSVQTLPKAKSVYVDVAVFLTKDRHFTIIYDESVGCTNGAKKIKFYRQPTMEGNWFIANSMLNLGGYGVGQRYLDGTTQKVKIKFNKDLHVQGLAGKYVTLSFRSMPNSMADLKANSGVTDYKFAADMLDSSGLCHKE